MGIGGGSPNCSPHLHRCGHWISTYTDPFVLKGDKWLPERSGSGLLLSPYREHMCMCLGGWKAVAIVVSQMSQQLSDIYGSFSRKRISESDIVQSHARLRVQKIGIVTPSYQFIHTFQKEK